MGWTNWVLNPSKGKRFFSSPKCPDWLWGVCYLLFSKYRVYFLGVKCLGHDVHPSPLPSSEVKKLWSSTSTHLKCLHVIDRVSLPYLSQLSSSLYCYIYRHPMKPTYDTVWKIQQIRLIKSCKISDIGESVKVLICNSVFKLINRPYFIRRVLLKILH